MKKGIVMEIHRKYAVLLTKDGSFEKGIILTEHAELGEEVVFQPVSKQTMWRRFWKKSSITVRLSAFVILALCIFFFSLLQESDDNKTHAYVAIDINPSIELELNDDFIVTDINMLNESAGQLIDKISNMQDKSFSSVLTDIVNDSEDQGFAEHKTMIVGISYEDQNDNPGELISKISPYIESLSDWKVATLIIPEEIRELAQDKNKSMNEMLALELVNHNIEIEQVNFQMTDSDDHAIIEFFYGKRESDINVDRSIEHEKIPMDPGDSQYMGDIPNG
ncbi:anti-sigma factor domain-containing protein [Oceanobacillus sp. CFH 90083]|uniref:anti-sigma factor domain-containing protein n=1 Tax=Oceanobacillus sp. CFH 90083 TaxID=2592336 RepID=UPI00128E06A6|nr:anti-sigma factor domain-containing protein [Oceanobacillus sp. CFH 90083]